MWCGFVLIFFFNFKIDNSKVFPKQREELSKSHFALYFALIKASKGLVFRYTSLKQYRCCYINSRDAVYLINGVWAHLIYCMLILSSFYILPLFHDRSYIQRMHHTPSFFIWAFFNQSFQGICALNFGNECQSIKERSDLPLVPKCTVFFLGLTKPLTRQGRKSDPVLPDVHCPQCIMERCRKARTILSLLKPSK